MAKPSDTDRANLAQIAYKHNLDSSDLEHVIDIESGFDPKAINYKSGAVGIAQWTAATLKRLGTSRNEVLDMPFAEQCALLDKYFDQIPKPIEHDVYMAFAAPSHVGDPDETVIYPVDKGPKSAWTQNPGWRSAGNGPITAGSIRAYAANAKRSKGHPTQTTGMALAVVLIIVLFGLRSRRA